MPTKSFPRGKVVPHKQWQINCGENNGILHFERDLHAISTADKLRLWWWFTSGFHWFAYARMIRIFV